MTQPNANVDGLGAGDVVWVALDPTRGREQSGHRSAVIVASNEYLEAATTLAIIVPVTSKGRGWPNHVLLRGATGLDSDSWAMTEHLRTISRDRITGVAGRLDRECLEDIRRYLREFLGV